MRIAIIAKGFSHSVNDWCLPPLIDLVRSLTDHVEVDVYTLLYPHERRDHRLFGARVLSFGMAGKSRLQRLRTLRDAEATLTRNHRSGPYDLIHAMWGDRPASLGAKLAHRLDVPLMVTLYAGEAVWLPKIGYGSLGRARQRVAAKRALQAAAVVTCGSDYMAAHVREGLEHEAQVVPLGLDRTRFTPDGPQAALEGTTRLITAASFGAVKGLDTILEALRLLAADQPGLMKGLHWHCVGPDPADTALRQGLAQQIGALPVTLHAPVPHWEMARMYRGADLALIGSRFESQCFAAMEPVSCGTPSFGTAVGILPQMASPDWCAPPDDPKALSGLLARVLSAPDRWQAELARQQDWLAREATVGVAQTRFLDLYRQVAG